MTLSTAAGKMALTATLSAAVNSFRKKRFDRLISGLEAGNLKISDSDLQSDQFIACFLKTHEAIEKSSAQEKVDFLVGLFVNGMKSDSIRENPDLYSEAISIFSELSYREIHALYLIGDILPSNDETGENSRIIERNEEASKLLSEEFDISEEYAYAIISRLQRTGLIISTNVLGNRPYVRLSEMYREIRTAIHFKIHRS